MPWTPRAIVQLTRLKISIFGRLGLLPNLELGLGRQVEVKDIKYFIELARRKDVKSAAIKKNGAVTKFKVRGSKNLYTLAVKDNDKAKKLIHSLPPNLKTTTITKKVPKKN
ncbi:hypothetical protein TRICI_005763 [Trichomonascus ciferrii]|uniref:Ribosomal protein L38e n=1 Tax=Trichomonascus ciferrii TaxID=44093 RepID=A0A642UQ12_9ASCO|nr:hypothetical protein TRICI_005763 [Trichomonascus ciferrii]